MTVQPIALTEPEARRLTWAERFRLGLVDRIAAEPWKVFPHLKPRPGEVQNGRHLYLIQAGDSAVKIGRSSDPARRIRELQPGSAEELRIVAVLPEMGSDEHYAHQRFAHLRLAGEWFSPSPEIFEWFGVQR